MRSNNLRRRLKDGLAGHCLAMALAAASAPPTVVRAADPVVTIDIAAGTLADALQSYIAQTRQQILYSSATVQGRQVEALHGRFTADEALRRILAGTNVDVERAGPNSVVLKPHVPAASGDDPPPADTGPTPGLAAQRESGQEDQSDSTPTLVVTGTHIRGLTVNASPVVTINQSDLRRNGDATIADALDRLPQNFSGQSTPNTYLAGTDSAATNTALSQGVNLRGIGASATLVLMNGQRLAGTGYFGDFVDLSSIPTAAVDHVEVLLDGASAVYGSDAVGGVVNVIMKKNFDGADTSLRWGEDAGGKGGGVQVGQTFGVTWDGGHLLLAYTYQHDKLLAAAARPYTANADLTSLGGTNHDVTNSDPGNILTYDNATSSYVSAYAIPAGSGLGLTASDFVAGATNEENFRKNTDMMPEQDRDGFYVDVGQAIDAKTSVDIEGRYNLRVWKQYSSADEPTFNVTSADPYFVSVGGASSELIGYALDSVGPESNSGISKSFDFSASVNRDLSKTWKLSAYAGFASSEEHSYTGRLTNYDHLNEALGNEPYDPSTTYNPAVDGYFNPYGDGTSNSKTILDFISDGWGQNQDQNQVSTVSLQADGQLFALPGGPVQAAFGAQFRHERFEATISSVTSDTPYIEGGTAYDRDVSAAFGELSIPVVSASNALPGIQQLSLSIAGRVEHYDDVGSTADPKLGVVWRPIHDVIVHATYGTSFRAPALSEVDQPTVVVPEFFPNGANQVLGLFEYGGNVKLKPQTAVTWTAGVDWTPHWIPGLKLGASWFDIDYTNQIANPGLSNYATILTNPAYASLYTKLDPNNAADLAKVTALLAKADPTYAPLYPASAYYAIVDGRYLNTASLVVSGADFNAVYNFDVGPNHIALGGAGTYLYNYLERTTPDGPQQQLVSTGGYPVNFRGKIYGTWSRGPFSSTLNVNYVNRYRDIVENRPIDAWTTVDLSVSWASQALAGPTKGVVITASAQNLFDTDPPFYDNSVGTGYDPANANPFGRMVAVQMDKRW